MGQRLYKLSKVIMLAGLTMVVASCSQNHAPDISPVISEDSYRRNLEILASDRFEGRAPGSKGEQLTVAFLQEKLQSFGVEPGNDGSYFQNVPLHAYQTGPSATLTISHDTGRTELSYGTDFVVNTPKLTSLHEIDSSNVVFAGYGIVAPEYGWNDYQGLDVRGKTVIVLVNDPGFTTGDNSLFIGKTMTYYGRHIYKYEEAARQGAAGLLIVHQTKPATYPWKVVRNSLAGPQRGLVTEDKNQSRAGIEGWISLEAARKIFRLAGQDFDRLHDSASGRDFTAVQLKLSLSAKIPNSYRFIDSTNVIGVVRGSKRPDEYVLYIAHWDHLGVGREVDGDKIYNGAADNATGVAGLLELAKAYSALEEKPERSIIFLSVTGEEYGLLGSDYYARNPVYPLNRTAAAFALDVMNYAGPTHDISVVGYGRSELDRTIDEVARDQQRQLTKNLGAESGYYYRSDHFSVAKQGLPSLFIIPGLNHREKGVQWMTKRRNDYYATRYHTPKDEYDPSWDLSGAVEDLKFMFEVGYRIALDDSFPNWNEGGEFKRIRDLDREGL